MDSGCLLSEVGIKWKIRENYSAYLPLPLPEVRRLTEQLKLWPDSEERVKTSRLDSTQGRIFLSEMAAMHEERERALVRRPASCEFQKYIRPLQKSVRRRDIRVP